MRPSTGLCYIEGKSFQQINARVDQQNLKDRWFDVKCYLLSLPVLIIFDEKDYSNIRISEPWKLFFTVRLLSRTHRLTIDSSQLSLQKIVYERKAFVWKYTSPFTCTDRKVAFKNLSLGYPPIKIKEDPRLRMQITVVNRSLSDGISVDSSLGNGPRIEAMSLREEFEVCDSS